MRKNTFLILFFSAILMTIFQVSCKKDPSKVGFEIQPPSDQMEVDGNDSILFFASYTVCRDSMITSNLSSLVLGSLNDPTFGTTQAAFNTQMRLESVNPSFGANVRLDSICLQLAYSGHWGDSATTFAAHVYQLTDSLWINADTTAEHTRTAYYATDQINYNHTPIGAKTFVPNLKDSVTIASQYDTVKYAPFLSIKLDQSFGEQLLADSSYFVSNSDFLKRFYGLRVDVDPVTGGFGNILYFSPSSTLTKVVMYYTNSDTSRTFSFPINTNCVRFNNYEQNHNMIDPEFRKQIDNPVAESGNQKLFLQPLIGTRIRVDFDGLDSLRAKSKIALNEVKLYLYVDSYDEKLPPPTQITMYVLNEKGETKPIPDASLGTSYFGGMFDKTNKRYVIRITRYVQQRLLNPAMDKDELYIAIAGAAYLANRVVLSGNNPNDGSARVKIGVIYTEY